MKDGSSRETSSKKVSDCMGSHWQEPLETTEFFFMVLVQNFYFVVRDHKCSKSREKNRASINSFYIDTSGRVATM